MRNTNALAGKSMKLAYVTTYDAHDVEKWSGTGYYIGQSLKNRSTDVEYIGSLRDTLATKILRKCKQHYYNLQHKNYLRDTEPFTLKQYAKEIDQKLSQTNSNIVFSATTNSIAYLDCKQPIAFWTDATFGSMINFYPEFSNLCQETIKHGNQMEEIALERCQLAIYSSDWAAQAAIKLHRADPAKVKVVPFGANLECDRTLDDIHTLVNSRPLDTCKLLFLGVDWQRKGGNVALEVARSLNKAGLKTELTVAGCQPEFEGTMPDFVKPLGFISKSSSEGKAKINKLFAEAHFLILPSLAECYGIVFCEANSFGVPCLATHVGGIPTAIKDNINGKTFAKDAAVSDYCDYITNMFSDYKQYRSLSISSFHEYQQRLNWEVAGQTVRNLLKELKR